MLICWSNSRRRDSESLKLLSLLQNKAWLEKFGADFQPGVEPLQELSGLERSRFALATGTQEDFHGFQITRGDLSPQVLGKSLTPCRESCPLETAAQMWNCCWLDIELKQKWCCLYQKMGRKVVLSGNRAKPQWIRSEQEVSQQNNTNNLYASAICCMVSAWSFPTSTQRAWKFEVLPQP